MAKNQKNQGFAAIRDVVSSSRFRESRFYICYTDKDPYIHMLIEQEREDGVGYWEERGDSYKIPIMTLERLYVKHKMISFDYLNRRETGVDAREGLIL